jgi:YfiH family protein
MILPMGMHLIEPDWPAPPNVVAFSTTREGGHSTGIYQGLNLGHHVGDNPVAVTANRASLHRALPPDTRIQWLSQVHSNTVVEAGTLIDYPSADAAWTRVPEQACAILSADCLPVLLCDRAGTVVAGAHAGWRGLLAGVLEQTVASMAVNPGEILAWMGPAIGPDVFEVGPEVKSHFLNVAAVDSKKQITACFTPLQKAPGHYLADLYRLARHRLAGVGVVEVFGGLHCTYSDPERFYSYRRNGQTGRMASLICLKAGDRLIGQST